MKLFTRGLRLIEFHKQRFGFANNLNFLRINMAEYEDKEELKEDLMDRLIALGSKKKFLSFDVLNRESEVDRLTGRVGADPAAIMGAAE